MSDAISVQTTELLILYRGGEQTRPRLRPLRWRHAIFGRNYELHMCVWGGGSKGYLHSIFLVLLRGVQFTVVQLKSIQRIQPYSSYYPCAVELWL
jgi:hypothetical protein